MEKASIVFIKQLLNSLESKFPKLKNSIKNLDAEEFNQIKRECYELNAQIDNLLK